MEDFIPRMHRLSNDAGFASSKLLHLAHAFELTGNMALAGDLHRMSVDLAKLARDAAEICAERVESDVRKSESMTREVVAMAFNGLTGRKGGAQ